MNKGQMTSIILFILIIIIGIVLGFKNLAHQNGAPDTRVTLNSSENAVIEHNENAILSGVYRVDIDKSLITWTASKKVVKNYTNKGSLSVSRGELSFTDEGFLRSGSVVVDVNSLTVTSAGTDGGEGGLKDHLLSEDFFDVKQYPDASFVMNTAEGTVGKGINISGNFTIKGVTQSLEIPATITIIDDSHAQLYTHFEFDRTDFGITYNSGKFFKNLGDRMIDDIVKLEVTLFLGQEEG